VLAEIDLVSDAEEGGTSDGAPTEPDLESDAVGEAVPAEGEEPASREGVSSEEPEKGGVHEEEVDSPSGGGGGAFESGTAVEASAPLLSIGDLTGEGRQPIEEINPQPSSSRDPRLDPMGAAAR
jgi:hypothetical protein